MPLPSGLSQADAIAEIEDSGLKVTGATDELKEFMAIFAPMSKKGKLGGDLRKKGFNFADPNGNGLCSLAEIENFILQSLMQAYPKDKTKKDDKGQDLERGRDLFDAFRPCYIRAYTDAKDIMPDSGEALDGTKDSTADDFLSWGEFRYFNIYICVYAAMYDAFAKIDGATGGGADNGRDGDDLRMETDEWLAGYKRVADIYGFQGLTSDKLGDDAAAMKVFGEIDDNGGGIVLMDEWSEYIKNCEINDGTLLGKSLAFEVSDDQKAASQAKLGGGKGKAAAPAAKGKKAVKGKAAAPAKGGAKGKAAAPAAKGAAKGAAKKGAAAKKSGGGGGGRIEDLDRDVAVKCIESSGLHVTDGTEDLSDFLAVFAPCSEKSDQGTKMRKAYFTYADPNGNGLCSLAECENYLLQMLMKVYPKDNDQVDDKGDKLERGRDLFDAFRPCYIRAYTDAKDIMPDTGEKLEGTKSTADDFLSFGEFRYFNIFICAYAAMYDGFAKIDGALGGGASEGRDGDDLRMEKDEWLAGYKAVAGAYGFEGLKKDKLGDDDAAMVVFNAIDDNGGGIVLLDEWAAYIKQCEADAGTELGKNLTFEVGLDGKGSSESAKKPAAKAKVTADKAPKAPGGKKGPAPPKPPSTSTKTPWPKILGWFREKRWRAVALKQMFTDLDADNSGDVDLQELVGGMKEMGLNLSDDEFLAFFHDLDANGDGAITRKEFTDAITKAVANDPSGMK